MEKTINHYGKEYQLKFRNVDQHYYNKGGDLSPRELNRVK